MNLTEYQNKAALTECNQVQSMKRMHQLAAVRLNHGVIGLVGEVGELAAAVERWVYYGSELDRVNIKEEVGDCLWYLALICNAVGLDMESCLEANLKKLARRYSQGCYNQEEALNRDLKKERGAVKG